MDRFERQVNEAPFGWPGGAGVLLALILTLAACTPSAGSTPSNQPVESMPPLHAQRVIAYEPIIAEGTTAALWPYFHNPEGVFGAPGGIFGVVSLGYDPNLAESQGGMLTIGFGREDAPLCVRDGPGADLIIYENAFPYAYEGIEGTYNEVLSVEVSEDGQIWHRFPPEIQPGLPLIEPARYTNLAGVTPTGEGGDGFDLAELPAAGLACQVRLRDGGTLYEDFGNSQTDLYFSGADIDSVEARYPVALP